MQNESFIYKMSKSNMTKIYNDFVPDTVRNS